MWRTSSRRLSAALGRPPPATAVRGAPIRHLRHFPASPSLESIHLGLAQRFGIEPSLNLVQGFAQAAAHYGRCYWELSKARLSILVVATSGAGFVLGNGGVIDIACLCWTCGGTMMVAASANSLNQVFEVKNDSLMKRTRQRPLPSGLLSVPHAATWASCLGLAGTTLLACKLMTLLLQANILTAGLAVSNLGLSAFVYTPLKQIRPVNTWVGAIVGAIPPLLGWAAAVGEISLNGMILPAALYFWQIPHFMALAYLCRHDYAAGGFKMFSLADASGQRTALVTLRNCLYMLPLGYVAYDLSKEFRTEYFLYQGLTSEWFGAESTLLTLILSAAAFSFYRDRTAQKARRMFHASLLYLPIFMAGMLFQWLPKTCSLQLEAEEPECLVGSAVKIETSDSSDNGNVDEGEKRLGSAPRSPVSYASIAPFPFLPAPSYVLFDI